MPNIGPFELLVILFIALLLLGPSRLPDLANALGKSIREFRKAASDVEDATAPPSTALQANVPRDQTSPNELRPPTTPEPATPTGPSDGPSGSDR